MTSKVILVVGPLQNYLSWLRTTRGLGGVRVVHIQEPKQIWGYCLERNKDEIVDLTDGDSSWRETLALAQSVVG